MDKTHVSQIGHPLCHLNTKNLDFSYFIEKILFTSIEKLFRPEPFFCLELLLPNFRLLSPARQSQEPPSLLVPVPGFKDDIVLN